MTNTSLLETVIAASDLAGIDADIVLATAFPDEHIPEDLNAEGCLVEAWLTDEHLAQVWTVIGRIAAVRRASRLANA